MIGFICIMYKSNNSPGRTTFGTINNLIESIYKFCDKHFILYLFDNASDEKYNLPSYPNIKYTYIEDQFIGGLATPYNDGIRMAVEDKCDLIILINDDIIINNSINKYIDIVLNHPHNDIGLYGPLTDGVPKKHPQLAQKPGKGIKEITNEGNINGFMMTFTPHFYHKFKLSNGDFADARWKWSGGEEVLQTRVRKNSGRLFIVRDCWFHHDRLSGWSLIEKWKKYEELKND